MHDDTCCQNRHTDVALSCACESAHRFHLHKSHKSESESFNHYGRAAFTSAILHTLWKKPERGVKMTHTALQ